MTDAKGRVIAILCGPANEHDSTRFIDAMESIGDLAGTKIKNKVAAVYADKGYSTRRIRDYLEDRNISCRIPYKSNSKAAVPKNQHRYNRTRVKVENFFSWLKNGFHRTRIRYERKCDNYLGFLYLALIRMYWEVLG